MTRQDQAAKDRTRNTSKSDQRQPQPGGLGNQNISRPAPIEQPEKSPGTPEQRGLEDLNLTRPAPTERR